LLAEFFFIIFVLSFVLCLETQTHASLADTLLRHASHPILPIFIIPIEHVALKSITL